MDTLSDIELEQRILGSLIVYPEKIDSSGLVEEDFSEPLHQRIFSRITHLHHEGVGISPLTVWTPMKGDGELVEVGGIDYLATMATMAPALPDLRFLGSQLKTTRQRRQIYLLSEETMEKAKDITKPVAEILDEADKALYALSDKAHYGSKSVTFSTAIKLALAQAEKAAEAGGRIVGLETRLTEIDKLLGGLQNSDLIIVAGRPGMGKTALATNMAFNIAKAKKPVLFFSLEMSAAQLSARILSETSGVEMWKARCGNMSPAEWDDYVLSGRELDETPLHIDDSGGLSLPQLVSRARKLKREHKIQLIVVDYIQLMAGGRKDGNRVLEITEITKGLKSLAKELDIPILALSQLSRGVDSRDDRRPVLSDLRDSGSIEQDADVVMFVYRQEYYLKSREPDISDPAYSKWMEAMERCSGKADVLVEKHRHGATKTIHLSFDGRFTKFSNLES